MKVITLPESLPDAPDNPPELEPAQPEPPTTAANDRFTVRTYVPRTGGASHQPQTTHRRRACQVAPPTVASALEPTHPHVVHARGSRPRSSMFTAIVAPSTTPRAAFAGASGERWIRAGSSSAAAGGAQLLQPGRYTELFFLDEATALAAGHRPCAECRREDYDRLPGIWRDRHPGQVGADAIDAQLHAERLDPASNERRLHRAPTGELPDGAFVLAEGGRRSCSARICGAGHPPGISSAAEERPGEALVITLRRSSRCCGLGGARSCRWSIRPQLGSLTDGNGYSAAICACSTNS